VAAKEAAVKDAERREAEARKAAAERPAPAPRPERAPRPEGADGRAAELESELTFLRGKFGELKRKSAQREAELRRYRGAYESHLRAYRLLKAEVDLLEAEVTYLRYGEEGYPERPARPDDELPDEPPAADVPIADAPEPIAAEAPIVEAPVAEAPVVEMSGEGTPAVEGTTEPA
jgi:hypothetical protein